MSRTRGGKKNGDRKSDRCGNDGVGSKPAHLERRIARFEAFKSGIGRGKGGGMTFSLGAFHMPGSNKK